jgi:O-antigen ligase
MMILSAFAFAIPDNKSFARITKSIEIAVIVNFVIIIWEVVEPTVIINITYARDIYTTAFDVLRPAGFWVNPDEAAFAFLFGLLISTRDRGMLAWICRIAAIGGIYFGASRAGVYILILYGVVYILYQLIYIKLSTTRLFVLLIFGFLVVILCLGVTIGLNFFTPKIFDNFQLNRILDFSESVSRSGYDRRGVTSIAIDAVLQAPLQGHGIFSMQGIGISSVGPSYSALSGIGIGAHNIYLAIWGEVGIIGLVGYLIVLFGGFFAALKTRLSAHDRLIAILMWVTYLMMGFVWHNQLTDVVGTIYIGLIFYFPKVVASHHSIQEAT